MTAARHAKASGLMKAAHAAAYLSREHREAGRLAEYLNESDHGARLYEDARIARGDPEALQDRTQRLLEREWLAEREQGRAEQRMRSELEREALEAATEALNRRRVRV